MATSAPAVSVWLTIAALAAASAYGSPVIIVITAIPMLIIANAYRRLNLWNANCGASFEWVGRAINPYLGFMTGWLMIAGNVIGTVSGVIVLGPSVLAIFQASADAIWPNVWITTAVIAVLLVIALVGIRLTARTQVSLAIVEYAILIGFAIFGLVAVLSHKHGTFPISSGWFSLHGIGGKGSPVAGFLLAVFAFTGWDATVYVNEEVRHKHRNPGRAAVIAVACLAVIYTVTIIGLQGGTTPGKLQANSSSALVFIAQSLAGGNWAKVMALALALSVIGTTGTSIVVIARILYGMASRRTLPVFLSNVSPRFRTPTAASIVTGVVLIALGWIYLIATSVQNAFSYLIDDSGILYISFYVLTALATIVYYRRRVFGSLWNGVILGILPFAAAAFLTWVLVKSMLSAAAPQNWALVGTAGLGILLLLSARFIQKSPFFSIPRESAAASSHRADSSRASL
ncbi:MAG TPA: APC family permease [Streptosporangiaceae bacterium]|nr:APC family permease [Streptosporangiaceae bacterium]